MTATVTMKRAFLLLNAILAVSARPQEAEPEVPACPITPFAIPLGNCSLSALVSSWGHLVEVGNPPARVCLSPSTVVNSTLINQLALCELSNPPLIGNQCQSLRGGFYDEGASSSWREGDETYKKTENPTWKHFNENEDLNKFGYDTLSFPDAGETFANLSIIPNSHGNQSNLGMLGLGKDSTFLQELVQRNASPSNSWGLDAGSQISQREGELVIGGYNRARVGGNIQWQPISRMEGARPCPLRVTISDIRLQDASGEFTSLESTSGEKQEACIEPYDTLFRLSPNYLQNWKEITNFNESLQSLYVDPNNELSFDEPGLLYNSSAFDEGQWSIEITLENGFKTTIPYREMGRPLTGWNAVGESRVVEGMTSISIFNKATEQGEDPTLGKIFLSGSYLAVDYEKGEFGLAFARTNPPEDDYVAMSCIEDDPEESPSPLPSDPAKSGSGGSSAPIGAIVGGAVGGVAVIILGIALIVYCGRKRRQEKEANAWPVAMGRKSSDRHNSRGSGRLFSTFSNGGGVSPRTGRSVDEGHLARIQSTPVHGYPNTADDIKPPEELP